MEWGVPPGREGATRLRRAGGPNPGGRGRAGLRRAPSPGPGDRRWGSEEPRRLGRAGLRRAGATGSRRGGSGAPRSVGGPTSMAGSAPSGWMVPAGPERVTGDSEEPRWRARNNRGPSPKAGDGVRGRDPDAVMLRSAEADPHITEHTLRAGAEAPDVTRGNCPATPMPKRRCRWWAIEPPPGADSLPGVTAETPPRNLPKGVPGRLRGRGRGRSVRCAGPHRSGVAAGLVEISQSSRLQGVAPLTSPLRHFAVASELALVSSMGFVFPFKVPGAPHHPGDARTGEPFAVEPELGLGGPLPESPRQAVAAGADGIPAVVHPLTRCRSRRGEWRQEGAEAGSRCRAFSAWPGTLLSRSGRAHGRSRGRRARTVPPESVRSARS
jgi:hypothetical protein